MEAIWLVHGVSRTELKLVDPLRLQLSYRAIFAVPCSHKIKSSLVYSRGEINPEEVLRLLRMMAFVPEIEMVKLLRPVLNALFSLLVEQTGNDDYEDLIFNALITVLRLVHDRRFNIGPMVDQYAKQEFNYPFVAPCLIRSLVRLLTNPTNPESSRKLRATFKVGHCILGFIVNARQLQKAKEAGIGITSTPAQFARELQPIFKALEDLMMNPAPALVGTQTLAVQYFHHLIPVLEGSVLQDDVAQTAFQFVESCANVKGKLIFFKLILINNLSRLSLFYEPEARQKLVMNTVRWLARHWGHVDEDNQQRRDQIRLCCTIISSQLTDLGRQEISQYVPKLVHSYCAVSSASRAGKRSYSMLFPNIYPFPSRSIEGEALFDEALIEISAILAALWDISSIVPLEIPSSELGDFLSSLLQVHLSVLRCEAFPATWLSLHIYHHLSSLKALEYIAANLTRSFLPQPEDAESFNTDLWRSFFTTC